VLDYIIRRDPKTNEEWIETELTGKALLSTFLLNKGTAFSYEERCELGLLGKLPQKIEILEEQVLRAYRQYKRYRSPLQKHIYLNNMHDKNEVLFYRLISEHIIEMLPIIYTPVVSLAVQSFSQEFRQPRGLYIAFPDQDKIKSILENRTHPEIKIIVVTDGERILGIGDQGIGGIDIPIAKLMLYTICGGVNPYFTLPIFLDAGTNNPKLLKDPLYLGWRHPRVTGKDYDEFVAKFVDGIKLHFPKAFLHWEDFGRDNAKRILDTYQDQLCTFNDDMQGTGVVTLAALMVAFKRLNQPFSQQRFVIFGGGTAGVGIADQITIALQHEGLTLNEARKRIWLIDKQGLLDRNMTNLTLSQMLYARESEGGLSLKEVVEKVHPTVLIGCSGMGGVFSESIVQTMAKYTERPIIFPLSNPTELSEANPADILNWTDGKAFVATGSPFGREFAQCNNLFAFPGIGLGLIAGQVRKLNQSILWRVVEILAESAPSDPNGRLLPDLSETKQVAKRVAKAVIEQAKQEQLSDLNPLVDIDHIIDETFWEPYYRPIRLKKPI